MESVYHIIAIRVNKTSWAHVWRLCSRYLKTGYDSQGRGVANRMSVNFLGGVVINLDQWSCTHPKHMMWCGRFINEISQQSKVMYTGYVQTLSNSHGEWCSSYIGTLLVEIFGYDVEEKGKYLVDWIIENRTMDLGSVVGENWRQSGWSFFWTPWNEKEGNGV
jgi:hypothetical protein